MQFIVVPGLQLFLQIICISCLASVGTCVCKPSKEGFCPLSWSLKHQCTYKSIRSMLKIQILQDDTALPPNATPSPRASDYVRMDWGLGIHIFHIYLTYGPHLEKH